MKGNKVMNAKIDHLTQAYQHSACCLRRRTSQIGGLIALVGRLAAGQILAVLLLSASLTTPHVAVAALSTTEEKGISLIIDDRTTLRFASGSFNAETIEGSIDDFILIIDGMETLRGDRLTLERTHSSDPEIFLIKSLEIDNLRSSLPAEAGFGLSVSQVRLSNIDVTNVVIADLKEAPNAEDVMKMAPMALYEGLPKLTLRDIKISSPLHGLSADHVEFEAQSGFTLDGGYPLFANTEFVLDGGHLHFWTNDNFAPGPGDMSHYFPDGLHIEMSMSTRGHKRGENFDINGEITTNIAELMMIKFATDITMPSDMIQRHQVLLERFEDAPYDENNIDLNRVLSDMEIVTDAYFLNSFDMTLADQGILDLMFVMSAPQHENLTPAESRIQTASVVPQLVASLPPLNTPENVAATQSFILNGGSVTLAMTPTDNQNMTALLQGFAEGKMPVVIKMQHQP